LGNFTQHCRDNIIEPISNRSDLLRHALAVAQNHEAIGNIQQLLQKVTDIDDSDA
jgi:hypothetical protein